MQAFTVSAAARLCSVDRRTLQRAIQAGRLSLDAQHCLSREALIAAGYLDCIGIPILRLPSRPRARSVRWGEEGTCCGPMMGWM